MHMATLALLRYPNVLTMNEPYELRLYSDVADWLNELDRRDPESYDHVIAAIERLLQAGPGLRRPTVGTIENSRYRNMRELRPRSGSTVSIRILFVFDPKRRVLLLVAGNKAAESQWAKWYAKAIREADTRYALYLASELEYDMKDA
jgi:hypothetical protein